MYEIFEHTADLGLRVKAESINTLFTEAALGLFSLVVENIDQILPKESLEIQIDGSDYQYLFFDWLNELLYILETQHLVFSKFTVNITDKKL